MKQQFRVLVIDDNQEILEMMEFMLSREGFEVVAAVDPVSGLRAVYHEHPDAVVLDVMMPQMDGFEVCRRIRELTDVPVLLYTGKAKEPEDVVRGFSVGADDYLVKPCVYRLRKKVEPDPSSPRYIRSVRGEGYYLEVNGD